MEQSHQSKVYLGPVSWLLCLKNKTRGWERMLKGRSEDPDLVGPSKEWWSLTEGKGRH